MLAAYLRFKDEPNTGNNFWYFLFNSDLIRIINLEVKYIPHMTYKALEIKNNPIFTKESEVYL